jgi:hypothetical protein
MDEVPNQPIDGLVVTKGGINFTFAAANLNIQYNRLTHAPPETYVQDPVISGTNAPFSVAFSVPVSNLQFGYATGSTSPVATLATVDLFNNSAVPFKTVSFGSTLTDPLAETLFIYDGSSGPVTNMTITPANPGLGALIFDNLTITPAPPTPPPTVPAATPLTLAITAISLAGFTMLLLRKLPA